MRSATQPYCNDCNTVEYGCVSLRMRFFSHNRIAMIAIQLTQPYCNDCNTVEYGCVSLRMRFFSQNFGTIKRILPGSSSASHREGPVIRIQSTRHGVWGMSSNNKSRPMNPDRNSTPHIITHVFSDRSIKHLNCNGVAKLLGG